MGYEHNDIAIMGGLRAALEEETPMFERNDIVTVYKMNEAIAEGGGGGGDFSIANVTFVNTGEEGTGYGVKIMVVQDDEIELADLPVTESVTDVPVPLYKGKAEWPASMFDGIQSEPVLTGGVSYDSENQTLVITGDGTFSADGQGGIH